MEKALFEIMRFNILTAALNPATRDKIDDGYLVAWENRVYPLNDGEDPQHETFSSLFHVDKSMMIELREYLESMHRAKIVPTFYDLEDKFRGKGRWDRMELVWACHYLKLRGAFDDVFWRRLGERHPSEASNIWLDYDREKEVYLN
jgi:hypothetical protein